MKITPEHRKQINAFCRARIASFWYCEVGSRFDLDDNVAGEYYNLRFLHGAGYDNTDLANIGRLCDLKQIEDHPSGEAEIDCYVYRRIDPFTHSQMAELYDNVQVLFKDGQIISMKTTLELGQ